MNILFLSFWYPTSQNPVKGIFIKEHASAIKNSGANIIVLALDVRSGNKLYHEKAEYFVDDNNIPTYIIHIESTLYKWIYINPFFLYSLVKKYLFKKILPQHQVDIIHSNILNPCALIGDWLSKKLNKPHVITEHWSKVDKYMKRNLLSSLGKRAYNRADAITAVSLFLKNNISKYFESPEKIVVIPNVINTSVFSFKEKNNIEHAISFLAVAHWFPPKMPMLFVKALNEVQKKISKKITLNLIGDGPLLEQIKALKLNYNINYLGSLSKEKIASYLHQTNFFLHASDVETFSMVIAEALSTGTPVIASDVGNIPNLVNINNGVLCKNTLPEWISGIEKCISTNYETQIISNEIQQKYNSEKIGTDFIRLYNKVIQQ